MAKIKAKARYNNQWATALVEVPGTKGDTAEAIINRLQQHPKFKISETTLIPGKRKDVTILIESGWIACGDMTYFRIDMEEGNVWDREKQKETRGEVVILRFQTKCIWAAPVADFAEDSQKQLDDLISYMEKVTNE